MWTPPGGQARFQNRVGGRSPRFFASTGSIRRKMSRRPSPDSQPTPDLGPDPLFEDFVTGFYDRAEATRAPASCIPTTCTNSSRTFGTAKPPRPDGAPHEGILLYPQVGEEPLTAEIRLEGFRIQDRTVNLDQDWRLIHDEMLGTIGCAGT